MADLNSLLHTLFGCKFLASCGMKEGAASVDNIAYGADLHRDKSTLHKSLVATVNSVNLDVIFTSRTNDSTHCRIHSRRISAAC